MHLWYGFDKQLSEHHIVSTLPNFALSYLSLVPALPPSGAESIAV